MVYPKTETTANLEKKWNSDPRLRRWTEELRQSRLSQRAPSLAEVKEQFRRNNARIGIPSNFD